MYGQSRLTKRQEGFVGRSQSLSAYQHAIEEVYWRHRICSRSAGANPGPKPPFDVIVSERQIERKVEDYLRKSQSFADQEAEIIATGIPPTNDLESAIVQNLDPGNYARCLRPELTGRR